MFIHWFPGHMTKAIRMMEKEIALVDSVIYVLDARAPLSCINPAFDAVIGNKPRIYVLNKCDLTDQADLKGWISYFSGSAPCLTANSLSKANAAALVNAICDVNKAQIQKYQLKGVNKTVRAMVIGVPNSGKSTLINSLTKEKRAATGNRPGVTRGKQWISIDKYIEVLDSPGVLFPDFKDQQKAVRLALLGSIKDDILDIGELSLELIKFMTKEYPAEFCERYRLDNSVLDGTPLQIMESVAEARGMLLKGGDVDYERTSRALIGDFRKGYFGKIILEKAR